LASANARSQRVCAAFAAKLVIISTSQHAVVKGATLGVKTNTGDPDQAVFAIGTAARPVFQDDDIDAAGRVRSPNHCRWRQVMVSSLPPPARGSHLPCCLPAVIAAAALNAFNVQQNITAIRAGVVPSEDQQ
jgi:2-methylcitrate dehydratase PrpD